MSIRLKSRIPAAIRLFFMRHLFGFAEDRPRRIPRIVEHNRLVLAAHYIRGGGIEIGGLNRPLKVNPNVGVRYVDRFSSKQLAANYPEVPTHKVLSPDIVANGETLGPILADTQDFVIANHIIEHFQNPLLFFRNAHRVLKPGGILFLAIPNKEKTFDQDRPVTEFAHLERDFAEGPEWSKRQHFEEFVALAKADKIGRPAWKTATEREALIGKLIADDYSIHFHVWDTEAMIEMVTRVRTDHNIGFRPVHFMTTGDEAVFILKKSS